MRFASLRRSASLATAILLAFSLLGAPMAAAQDQYREGDTFEEGSDPVDYFYDKLAPYGKWIEHRRYGLVWYPRDVDEDWRPYTVGRWVLTNEHGWLWESDEPWGWAVYHYGRWAIDDDIGWIWIPGDEWAPAWVDWREGDGVVGWAPLPPEARWRDGFFDDRAADLDGRTYRSHWIFVPEAFFVSYGITATYFPPPVTSP